MSNIPKDHPSIRVHAPPGGHSNNIFGTEFEQSAANKKKHMESDIFGSKADTHEPAPAAKSTRSTGNNIFGTDTEHANPRGGTIAGQFKQTQMKSSIFGSDEPASTRTVSEKNKSDIFGVNEQNNHSAGVRQGRRDPNASRMGYNPINGEAYTPKENANTTEKEADSTTKPAEDENGHGHVEVANENVPTPAATTDVKKVEEPANEQKNVHTSVRVFHPPGGRSNGPLW